MNAEVEDKFVYYAVANENRIIIGTERMEVSKINRTMVVPANMHRVHPEVYQEIEAKSGKGYVFKIADGGDIVEYRDLQELKRIAINFMHKLRHDYVDRGIFVIVDDERIIMTETELLLMSLSLTTNVKFSIIRDEKCIEIRPIKLHSMLPSVFKKRNQINELFVECVEKVRRSMSEGEILKIVNRIFKCQIEDTFGIEIEQELT